jgi:hypothetical protein
MTLVQRIYSAAAITCCLMHALACQTAVAAEAKQVMLLHSFGKDFKPWSEYARTIRMELNQQSRWPLPRSNFWSQRNDHDQKTQVADHEQCGGLGSVCRLLRCLEVG